MAKNIFLFLLIMMSCIYCKFDTTDSISIKEKINNNELDTLNFPSMRYFSAMEEIKETDKPILIFFNAYGCVRCRTMEEILRDSIGFDKILDKFEFINLYVDDRRFMSKKDWFEKDSKLYKRVFHENYKTQTKLLKNGSQPYLTTMRNNEIIANVGFRKNKETIFDFLFTE